MAHLVLPDTQANPSQNQKSHFLPTHRKTTKSKLIAFYLAKWDTNKNKIYLCDLTSFEQMNRIKEVLDEKGIKQTWLAEQLGKSYNMVNAYVQNRQQPRIEVLYDIAKILGVNVKDLLTDSDIKKDNQWARNKK